MTPTKEELQNRGEKLKELLWSFMNYHSQEHLGLMESMNELLDLIDELEETA
jgi:hypothetical protein